MVIIFQSRTDEILYLEQVLDNRCDICKTKHISTFNVTHSVVSLCIKCRFMRYD